MLRSCSNIFLFVLIKFGFSNISFSCSNMCPPCSNISPKSSNIHSVSSNIRWQCSNKTINPFTHPSKSVLVDTITAQSSNKHPNFSNNRPTSSNNRSHCSNKTINSPSPSPNQYPHTPSSQQNTSLTPLPELGCYLHVF